MEPEFAVLSQEMGKHLVPADFLLNFIRLSKIDKILADYKVGVRVLVLPPPPAYPAQTIT